METSKIEQIDLFQNTKTQRTYDYDKFKFFECNRPMRENKDLKLSMEKRNDLHLFPIVVTTDYYIIDGQHRFKYAKELGLEIFFMVNENYDMNDMAIWNSSQKKWTYEDFAHFYATRGIESYKLVLDLSKKYKISLNVLVRMYSNTYSNFCHNFKLGKFKISENNIQRCEEEILKIIELADVFRKNSITNHVNQETYSSLLSLIRNENFDLEHFKSKITQNTIIVKEILRTRKASYITAKLILEVYNKGLHVSNRLEVKIS
jgi:disulfide oxidoreductase YuzD